MYLFIYLFIYFHVTVPEMFPTQCLFSSDPYRTATEVPTYCGERKLTTKVDLKSNI